MSEAQVPGPLRAPTVTAKVIRQKIWKRCNVDNEHFMAGVVGREGSGKSYTSLRIAETVDPTFNADRVMFDPQAFLERLQEKDDVKGDVVVIDEAGVGVGSRTWYEKEQIKFNQVLQVVRDENMAALFTLPRLSELDSMARGRLHAYLEMDDLEAGEYATLRWKNLNPTRDERDKLYKYYPRMRVEGRKRRITNLKIGPPSEELARAYDKRKEQFQQELYDDAVEEYQDDEQEKEMTVQQIADEIVEQGPEEYVQENPAGDYLDKDLIEIDYGIGQGKSKKVKKLVLRESDLDVR